MEKYLKKEDLVFIPFDNSVIDLKGNWINKGDHIIGTEEKSSTIEFKLEHVTRLYGVFIKHDWSGKVLIEINDQISETIDLYSRYSFAEKICLYKSQSPSAVKIKITSIGRNEWSKASEIVFKGILLLKKEFTPNETGNPRRFDSADHISAEDFAKAQAQMTDNWLQAIKDRGANVDEVVEQRYRAYSKRIKETLIYTTPGNKMLDIGAGNLFEKMLTDVILPSKVDYWVHDIDQRCVESAKVLFAKHGINPDQARQGDNTLLSYKDGFFDLVFASHCIEHSPDLGKTFTEIWRILKSGGFFIYAVPFGWDETLEHMYSFSIEEWLHLTSEYSFDVINYRIAKEYPESGYDLHVIGKKH